MRYLGVINETSYLSVPNALQYRTIMRIFYQEYEKMRFQLYKEDVLELLHRNPAYVSSRQADSLILYLT